MKIADISVSRIHSYIRFVGQDLVLFDNGSKFGTMIRVSKPTKILETRDSANKSRPNLNSCIYQIG